MKLHVYLSGINSWEIIEATMMNLSVVKIQVPRMSKWKGWNFWYQWVELTSFKGTRKVRGCTWGLTLYIWVGLQTICHIAFLTTKLPNIVIRQSVNELQSERKVTEEQQMRYMNSARDCIYFPISELTCDVEFTG